jgi:NAD(P)H-flavin reductase
MEPRPFRVERVIKELADCFTLVLTPTDGHCAFPFQPGQFNMLYDFGHGEVPVSMSGDPSRPEELVHTIRSVGLVTAAMQKLRPGDVIGVRGPFGSHWPLAQSKGKDILVMAGGLGLAPLRPVIYDLKNHAADYGRLTLLYGTRTPDTLLFADELQSWSEHWATSLTVDSAGPRWGGHVGVVTDLLDGRVHHAANTVAFLCGPEIMMRFCAYALLDRGFLPEQIFVSLELNMKCALGMCGRCQYGPFFICKDGPVFSFAQVARLFRIREM